MAGPGAQLTRVHQIQQINNGAAGAALIVELGNLLKAGDLDEQGFITAVVGADLLTHQAAVRLARQYLTNFRALVAPEENHAELVNPEFDAGASAGRAVNALRELEEARSADPEQRNWDSEFARIVGQLAVHSDKAAKNAGRDTVVESAEANGKRWRRVTDGNPCAFCAMLAGRGPVYRSEDSAGIVVGRGKSPKARGSRGLGSRFHDYCGCSVEESLVEWEPTAREQEFADLYNRAVEACQADGIPASTTNVLGKMRELGDGIVNDAHKPETATGGAGSGSKPPGSGRSSAGEGPSESRLPRLPAASHGLLTRHETAMPPPHELDTANRLAAIGLSVHIRERVEEEGVKNPDFLIDGEIWEAKSPTGSGRHTISNQFSRAGHQAQRMVLDLSRTPIADEAALQEVSARLSRHKRLREVLVILKSGDVVRLSQ